MIVYNISIKTHLRLVVVCKLEIDLSTIPVYLGSRAQESPLNVWTFLLVYGHKKYILMLFYLFLYILLILCTEMSISVVWAHSCVYTADILTELADGFYNAVKSLEMERNAALKPLSMKCLNVATFSLLTGSFYSLVQNLAEVHRFLLSWAL